MVFSKQSYYVKLRKEMTLRAAPQVKTKKNADHAQNKYIVPKSR